MGAYQGGAITISVGVGVILLCVTNITSYIYIETMLIRPFEESIKKRHQRDANLCGTCARPTDERSLVRGGGEYNQGSFVYSAKA